MYEGYPYNQKNYIIIKLGDDVTMSYCSKCGFVLVEGAKFCHECGAKQDDLMNNIEKRNFNEVNHTDVQPDEHSSKKHSGNEKTYNSIKVGTLIVLIGLIVFSVGFGSYFIYSSMLSADNTKKSNTSSKLTPKSNNDSKSDATTTAEDKNESKDSKVDASTSKINSSDAYVFPNSGDKKLLDSDLSSLSKEKLALVRNEIFARHGHVFQEEPYKSYFNGKSWYKPNSNLKGKDEELNNIERYNVQLILKYEKK